MIFRVLGLLLRRFLLKLGQAAHSFNLGLFCRRFKGGSRSTVVYVDPAGGKKIKQRNNQYNLNKQKLISSSFFFPFFPIWMLLLSLVGSYLEEYHRWVFIFKRLPNLK